MNNESPYWSGIPEGVCGAGKDRVGLGKPELECLIQTFKFPGQFGTHIDFPGHFIKGKALSEKYDVNDLIFPAGGHRYFPAGQERPPLRCDSGGHQGL